MRHLLLRGKCCDPACPAVGAARKRDPSDHFWVSGDRWWSASRRGAV